MRFSNFDISCSVCKNYLEAKELGNFQISIEPCKTCLSLPGSFNIPKELSPTPKQLKAIENMSVGFDLPYVIPTTRKEASDLIEQMMSDIEDLKENSDTFDSWSTRKGY